MKSNKEILKILAKQKPFWSSLGFGYEDPKKAVRFTGFATDLTLRSFGTHRSIMRHWAWRPSNIKETIFSV